MNAVTNDYSASAITILKGLEPVRKRPGMYIGETNRKGLHHLIAEILDNSVDEAIAGHCSHITIKFNPDNSMELSDNGRGIPTDIHPEEGIATATIVFTVLHAGGKFGAENSGYEVSGGLHGVGASVVNALSEYLEVTIKRQGKVFFQRFEKGIPVTELVLVRDMTSEEHTGTSVKFKPDADMFPEAKEEEGGLKLSPIYILDRVKRTAYLCKKLRIDLIQEDGTSDTYYSENGIIDLVKDNTAEIIKTVQLSEEEKEDFNPNLTDNLYITGKDDKSPNPASVEVSFEYVNRYFESSIMSFANNIYTENGGTHVQGFEKAILKCINDYGAKNMNLTQLFLKEDVQEGLNAVISIKIKEPKFSDQTKKKFIVGTVSTLVYNVVKEEFEHYLELNPEIAKLIVNKAISTKSLREKLEKDRNKIRRDHTMSRIGGLPGKLTDCRSKDLETSELFLVEGDSAGGSAKQARNKDTQAILPLKGKILNTTKSDNDKIVDSQEIKNLIAAIRTDFGENYNASKLRYGKIIIMTDADVDGSHIAVLLLTFFLNQMPQLVKDGRIYLAMPPLYVVKPTSGKAKSKYYFDDAALKLDYPNEKPNSLSRFKGLGEMNADQLKETTMNPETRTLMKVEYKEEYASDIAQVFEDLMGKNVEKRRNFIVENAQYANLDI